MLENLQLGLTVSRKFKDRVLEDGSGHDHTRDEEADGSMSSAELRIGLALSAVDISFASSELIFLAGLAHDAIDVFAPPEEAGAMGASTGAAVASSAPWQSAQKVAKARAPRAGFPGA